MKELVEKAGFVLWADEAWKPEHAIVDWSSQYDNELQKLVELIIQECALVANEHIDEIESINYGVGAKIKRHFGAE